MSRPSRQLMTRALEEIYSKLELVESTATPVVRRELEPILTGEERQRAFDELQTGLSAEPRSDRRLPPCDRGRARAI